MTIKTVRLDARSEALLADLLERTGMNVSEAIKAGLVVLHQQMRAAGARRPYEVYRMLDLGPGGYALAPADRAKERIADTIRRHKRR